MIYSITYQKMVTIEVEAKDIDHAARIACQVVLGSSTKAPVKVLSIYPGVPESQT